ncbi:MAG TPA: hypothetical protein VNE62_03085 [Actinomycetota bacterium]|nr:hypothetical protein [Actinomycetota bacterium]
MRHALNQHSFLIAALGVTAVVAVLVHGRAWWVQALALLVVAGAAGAVFMSYRTGVGDVREPADLDAALKSGRPVALQFYSDL